MAPHSERGERRGGLEQHEHERRCDRRQPRELAADRQQDRVGQRERRAQRVPATQRQQVPWDNSSLVVLLRSRFPFSLRTILICAARVIA